MTPTAIQPDIKSEFDLLDRKSDALKSIREDALNAFNKLGYPTTRHEEWKYTNLKNILAQPLKIKTASPKSKIDKSIVDRYRLAGEDAAVLVFENGIFNKSLSDKLHLTNNIIVKNLSEAIDSHFTDKYLGKVAEFSNETFVALNTAFIQDGVFIHIPANFVSGQAIHCLHINTNTETDAVFNIRNLIVAERGSKVTVIESYHAIDDNCKGLINAVTEVVVYENANVELVKAQLDSDQASQINYTQVLQSKDSTFDTVTVTLSGALVRNNLHIKLNDVNCTSHLFGLYILDGDQLVDNHTLVDHAKPNCFSNELYKGLIGGKACGVFNGKIFVREDAQKTNAYQSNKNILLSDDASVFTKPQLEIFADDVKCTHGATTGQMDEDALFYLRARGIGQKNARALLNIAFAGDVLNNIKNETLKENLLNLSVDKLNKNEG